MKVDNGTTNFAVYEDATEFYGMAEVTLPEITQITEEVKGAGISGAFNGAFVGHIEAMTLTLNFRSVTADAVKLAVLQFAKVQQRFRTLYTACWEQ